ncbi:MAG: TRAP transporter small permease [Marinomonas sp.]
MGAIKFISNKILTLQEILAVLCSVFIVLGVGSGAFFRYVLGVSFHGLEELLVIGAFWMYFIGASYASHKGKHISAEVFSVYCSIPVLRYSVSVLANFITVGLSILYTYFGWEFLVWSFEAGGTTSRLQIPLVFGHSAVFVGFFLMSCYFFNDLMGEVKKLKAAYYGKPTE